MQTFSYSVLMSVYAGENAENLMQSLNSMFQQTMPTDDFLLVCDGPLSNELNAVIDIYKKKYSEELHILRIHKNGGLGRALRIGLPRCRHELVARMDSDDISYQDRCERELEAFARNPSLDLLSGTVTEFMDRPEEILGVRRLPLSEKEIRSFSRKRNPMNHPAVMFRKTAVLSAGNYCSRYPLFEDYDLWIRMFKNGSHAANLSEPLVNMRVSPDLYKRRGGWKYAEDMMRFHTDLLRVGWASPADYFTGAIPHGMLCLMPNEIRRTAYRLIHI